MPLPLGRGISSVCSEEKSLKTREVCSLKLFLYPDPLQNCNGVFFMVEYYNDKKKGDIMLEPGVDIDLDFGKKFCADEKLFYERLGERLKQLRIISDYPMDFVSVHICVSEAELEEIEAGKVYISAYKLKKYSEILNIPEERLTNNIFCNEDTYRYETIVLKVLCIMKRLKINDAYSDLQRLFKEVFFVSNV